MFIILTIFFSSGPDLVEDLLPDDFELAENLSFLYDDKHPVLLLFGDQTDGAMLAGGTVTPAPPINRGHYSKMILAVPYVKHSEQTHRDTHGPPAGEWLCLLAHCCCTN